MSQSVLSTMPAATTGTLLVTDHLNFWGGKRVPAREEKNAEPVFEPATGNMHRRSSLAPWQMTARFVMIAKKW